MKALLVGLAVFVLLLAGCESNPPPAEIVFPTQRQPADDRALMEDGLAGTLSVEDGCLRLISLEGGILYTPVWPPDYAIQPSEPAAIIEPSGEELARVGDDIYLSGGEVQSLSGRDDLLDPAQADEVAEVCPGPYWIVGDQLQRDPTAP